MLEGTIMSVAISLLVVQGLLGGFDTIYHHELRIALPQKRSAKLELMIHGIRAVLYAVLFLSIAFIKFQGNWVWAIAGLVLIEILLTLWDFVVEDGSRKLPPTERIIHTILAINGGAIFGFVGFQLFHWFYEPTGLIMTNYGWRSWALALFGVGVFASGIRDLLASYRWNRRPIPENPFELVAHQRVLVTGATGFIGSALVSQLLDARHQVTVLARSPLSAAYLFQSRARVVTHMSQLHHSEVFDVVINLAGAPVVGPRWSSKRKQQLLDSRVKTTHSLLAWFTEATHRPSVWIQASAIGYYGVRSSDERLTEASHAGAGFMSELCQAWETTAETAQELGIRQVVLRLGLVFGSGGALPQLLMPYRFGLGGKLGSGEQIMSWVHLQDVIQVMALSINDASMQGVYNMVAPDAISQGRFAKTVATFFGRPAKFNIPETLLRRAGGEMAALFVDGQYVVPERLLQAKYEFQYPTLTSVLADEA